jgi:hypothetical protein
MFSTEIPVQKPKKEKVTHAGITKYALRKG